MATLREYFDTDFPAVLNTATTLTVNFSNGAVSGTFQVLARVHCDFNSGTKYVSYFVPSSPDSFAWCEILIMNPSLSLEVGKGVEVTSSYPGERELNASDLKFSGRIFLYVEEPLSDEQCVQLYELGKQYGADLVIRTPASSLQRSRFEKPLAFISHDWRDKEEIARPIALGLSKMRCPIWYDEYSLKVGESLRTSVEKGLKECKKCVLIISPHFLKNTGWTKTEFDSVFTRQIIEGSNVVLPVWCGVTKQQVYEYSPSLLDRLAVEWDQGLEQVLAKLYRAIEPPLSNYQPV
jgi:hypothetical protein